jgi:hypothetical protein
VLLLLRLRLAIALRVSDRQATRGTSRHKTLGDMQMEESIICPYIYITTACIEYVNPSTQQKMGWLMERRGSPRHSLTDRTAVQGPSGLVMSLTIHDISAIGSALPGYAKPCQAPNLGMHCVSDDLGGRPRQCLLGLSLCRAENALQAVHELSLGLTLVTQNSGDAAGAVLSATRRTEYGIRWVETCHS